MSDDAAFLAYALLFRFGIIGAGLVTIFLGHSLLRGSRARATASDTVPATVEASIPGGRFRLHNVSAGSIFALFGAVLIVAMVLQGNPERTRQTLISGNTRSETVKMRGDYTDPVGMSTRAGNDAAKRGDTLEAENRFRMALNDAAPAMNGLAYIYAKNLKANEAIPLSLSAVELDPSNAHYLDTLAEAEMGVGDWPAALRAIEKAAQLDSTFKPRLEDIRRRSAK